jgi:MEMO1 family protein
LLTSGSFDSYADHLPHSSDVILLIEVSDSSLPYHRGVKLSAYARAGIQEVWIVDLANGQVETYTEPLATGYQQRAVARLDDRLMPRAMASISVTVRKIIG